MRPAAWLLLVHQLPARPSGARVKTWRRLQELGALAVKNAAYLLPNSAQAREDFEWMKAEVVSMKGDAVVFAADTVDARSHEELVAQFRQARAPEYEAIRRQAESLASRVGSSRGSRRGAITTVRALRERLVALEKIDFFAAPGRDKAQGALEDLMRRLEGGSAPNRTSGPRLDPTDFRGKLWVTRPRPGIDRMASAWLIRRFIDPRARFAFEEKPPTRAAVVPFDMYGVEFSHQGRACTFETLARRFAIEGRGVKWLSRIVHEIDLKDSSESLPEAAGIGRLVEGLRQTHADDRELLERGIAVFEALYHAAGDRRPEKAKRPSRGK